MAPKPKKEAYSICVYVCSEHFESNCFERDLKAELMGTKEINILKDDAFTTIFSHVLSPSRKRISSLQRESKKAKKDLVEHAIDDYDEILTAERK